LKWATEPVVGLTNQPLKRETILLLPQIIYGLYGGVGIPSAWTLVYDLAIANELAPYSLSKADTNVV